MNIRDGKKVQQNSAESYEDPPVYKKDGRADKSNYSPISVLSNVSKKYERWFINFYTITLIKI